MTILSEGTWPCKVLSASTGNNYRQLYAVQVNVELTDGPDKGKRTTYEQEVDNKSSKYVNPSCKAIGWQGVTLKTLTDDCAKWIAKAGGTTTVDIKHFPLKKEEAIAKAISRAQAAGEAPYLFFAKANAIGRGAVPLTAPSTDAQNDADAAMRAFAGDTGGGGWSGDTPPSTDDIPFASCAISDDVNPIAAVLR